MLSSEHPVEVRIAGLREYGLEQYQGDLDSDRQTQWNDLRLSPHYTSTSFLQPTSFLKPFLHTFASN